MAIAGLLRGSAVFAALAGALVTGYFAFSVFAGKVLLDYGVKTVDFGWQAQRLGNGWFLSAVTPRGPASGSLRPGDRLISLNGDSLESPEALRMAMLSVSTSGLYTIKVLRAGQAKEFWLRPRTTAGLTFFQERLPLLASSFLLFISGLAMLLNWSSPAARLGFLAAACAALRMGSWGILPLSNHFQPGEHQAYFLFWLPAGLALPFAFHALLYLNPETSPTRSWRLTAMGLYAAWGLGVASLIRLGAVPAPVPDGVALVFWDRVQYSHSFFLLQVGVPIFLALTMLLSTFRIVSSGRNASTHLARARRQWLILAGLVFVLPAALMEMLEWLRLGAGGIGWSLLPAFASIVFSYMIATDHVSSPAAAFRGLISGFLPESLFRLFDRRWFPEAARAETDLRDVARQLDECRQIEHLNTILVSGMLTALNPASIELNEEGGMDDVLEVGPRASGEPYTRREEKLYRQALHSYFAAQKRIATETAGAGEKMDLLRECPRCGACYGGDVVLCPADGEVPRLTLPVERIIDGKYRVDRRIGRGGMGAVYEGRDLRLDRRIAVKIMLSELFGHESAIKRFEREAQAAARLNHPNVIQVHDYGPIGAMGAYLVMEFVEGSSWRQQLNAADGPVPAAVCLPWIRQLLDGVAAAHESGIIHRDLKPENLLLAESGDGLPRLKILDFGLAKMKLLSFSLHEKLSLGVTTIGTVGYVPPEQLTGGEVDERSDLYAIGRIVAETLTGALSDPGSVNLDEPLAGILNRATAPARDARYDSVADLRAELLPAMEALLGQVSPPVLWKS
jgi:hypothetical protein